MVTGDRISSLFGLLFALYILKESFGLDVGRLHQPGPGFFSLFGGILLGVFSIILFVRSLLPRPRRKDRKAEGEEENPRFVIYVFVGLLVYTFIFEWLGFILSTFLLVALLLVFFDSQKWWKVLLTAAVASSSSYIIFSVLLKSELPKGILEIFL
jgi:putative tricarboxylic transport membrane protein